MLPLNTRVRYIAPCPVHLHMATGVITDNRCSVYTVRFDDPHPPRMVAAHEIEEIKTMTNFKIETKTATDKLIEDNKTLSAEDNAARRLGIGYELARIAEDLKKKSKVQLTKLGLIPASFTPGDTQTLLDTNKFVVMSITQQPALRLNEAALRAALDAEKLSAPAKARILAAAFVEAKPSTTYKVEQR